MVGCKLLISKVGITTLVKVSCNQVPPSFSFMRLLRYFPSYLGPTIDLSMLMIQPKIPLPLK